MRTLLSLRLFFDHPRDHPRVLDKRAKNNIFLFLFQGLAFDVGHVDFYVNNIKLQPGCEKELMPPGTPTAIMGEVQAYFACGHYRAPQLFAATINPASEKCSTTFRFCHCAHAKTHYHDIDHISNETIKSCPYEDTQMLGYNSHRLAHRHGAYCGITSADHPYC